MIEFNQEICCDLNQASQREWLENNGLGGFASSTITGLNTRRYHGLLIAATKPPVGRLLLLSKLEEMLVIDGERYDLSVNQYSRHQAIRATLPATPAAFLNAMARIIKVRFGPGCWSRSSPHI